MAVRTLNWFAVKSLAERGYIFKVFWCVHKLMNVKELGLINYHANEDRTNGTSKIFPLFFVFKKFSWHWSNSMTHLPSSAAINYECPKWFEAKLLIAEMGALHNELHK